MSKHETIVLPKHLPEHILNKLDEKLNQNTNVNLSLQIEPLSNTMEALEEQVILMALQRNNWNISHTARQLDIKRQSLQYRMKKYCIKQPLKK